MIPFHFKGQMSASKSLMNRYLVAQSFNEQIELQGSSQCSDVVMMQNCLRDLKTGKTEFDCGEGGTTFRFFLARLSRVPGTYKVKATKRLLERPHHGLFQGLSQLGVKVEHLSDTEVEVKTSGWNWVAPVNMDLKVSSQFLSALLLSSWGLEKPLEINFGSDRNSFSYLEMTLSLLKALGLKFEIGNDMLTIDAHCEPKPGEYSVEPDMSSAFALAALAVSNGTLELENFPASSWQPDFSFIEILKSIKADVENTERVLRVTNKNSITGGSFDLSNTPDLFPVLAVLLSRADGESKLTGLQSLVHKESDRLKKTMELLKSLNIACHLEGEIFVISGQKKHNYPGEFRFDPDQDHRMVMAAALAKYQGAAIQILQPEVVSKSFPEYLEIVKC